MQRAISTGVALCLFAVGVQADEPDWVEKSNQHAQIVLNMIAELSPESAASLGVDGLDEEISDFGPGIYERSMQKRAAVLAELERRLAAETNTKVRQDLEILVRTVGDDMRSSELDRNQMLPYINVSQALFRGLRSLIDPQISPDRYAAAVVRMRKYAGLVDGYQPFTENAKAYTSERFEVDGLTGPYRGQVEQDLQKAETMISGIEELLAGTDLQGWEETYETLAGQMRDYNDWVRAEILPRARDDYRLPLVMYQDGLKNWGVDEKPEALIEIASKGYMDIRNEMEALAPLVAKEKGYDTNDFREVIALLKKDGAIAGDQILDAYHGVLSDIEEIIVRERIVSLPERDAGIRIGTAAETAAQPAPHLEIPRLIGNTGEYPTFIVPLIEQNEDGSWPPSDDTYEAGTWTLVAHEARPGHEMQFSSILESGVSLTRAIFAFNSANVEGWGLYAEAIVRPYLPLDAQMISLQFRLIRAARMFLDPMLNLGLITPAEAKRLMIEDMVVSESWAQNEIERYTYRAPGQATAYYYGYGKMQALRAQTELKLQDDFNQQAFHDFVLGQGMLPPDLLKQAVMDEFVPNAMKP